MAGRKPNATVCGIPALLGGAMSYGGGHLTAGIGPLGHWRAISKPGAKRLLAALFGHERVPRPGYEIKLCGDQYLENISGSLQVRKRGSGEISGRKADRAMAKRSLVEEKRAIVDYGSRAKKASDPKLARIFRHNRAEEKTHAKHLRRYLGDACPADIGKRRAPRSLRRAR